MSSTPLSIKGLTKRFDAGTINEKLVLDRFELSLHAGQFVTLLGSNGSGKTTLFNLILGRLLPDVGAILLGDEDITRQKDYKRALNIGCLYQNPLCGTAPNMTLEENLALAYTRKASRTFFAVNRRDNAYFRDQLALLGLGLEDRMKTKMGLLSGGQRHAASLLMETIAQPRLLLLDEHTAALDPGAAEKVMAVTQQIVARDHITTLMITHDMDYALRVGERTILLQDGKISLDLFGQDRESMTSGRLAELFYTRPRK